MKADFRASNGNVSLVRTASSETQIPRLTGLSAALGGRGAVWRDADTARFLGMRHRGGRADCREGRGGGDGPAGRTDPVQRGPSAGGGRGGGGTGAAWRASGGAGAAGGAARMRGVVCIWQ